MTPVSHGQGRPSASAVAKREDHELELLDETIHHLPKRCREVLVLRMRHGLTLTQIARELGRSEETVVSQACAGVRRGMESFADEAAAAPGDVTDEIRNAAAEWVVEEDRGLSPPERAELETWLAAARGHRAAWEEARAAWRHLERCTELSERNVMTGEDLTPLPAESATPARPADEGEGGPTIGVWSNWMAVAAAGLLVLMGAGYVTYLL
ncbi:sigma-70 family RNA polymerase sigma factor [Opitutus sp. ER46]|uniref:sigma-70 family RNA polymerase sigma factor n=1 Tax=Opitutus sp. ER46 TaxID=2161864 RepID=UPI001304C3CE|nr:sigma-70 family RNA polymerase sigma factor [Opitutus sp. ER46]